MLNKYMIHYNYGGRVLQNYRIENMCINVIDLFRRLIFISGKLTKRGVNYC